MLEKPLKGNQRMNGHRSAIRAKKHLLLAEHFNGSSGCSLEHLVGQPIEQIHKCATDKLTKKGRLRRESFWIKELRTLTSYGLNDRLDSHDWRFRTRDDRKENVSKEPNVVNVVRRKIETALAHTIH